MSGPIQKGGGRFPQPFRTRYGAVEAIQGMDWDSSLTFTNAKRFRTWTQHKSVDPETDGPHIYPGPGWARGPSTPRSRVNLGHQRPKDPHPGPGNTALLTIGQRRPATFEIKLTTVLHF
jgi:hypothetical protein